MAVTFVTTASSDQILEALDLGVITRHNMKKYGLQVVFYPAKVEVVMPVQIPDVGEIIAASLSPYERLYIKKLDVNAGAGGTSGGLAKKIDQLVYRAVSYMDNQGVVSSKFSDSPFSKLPPPSVAPSPVVPAATSSYDVFPKSERFTAPRVEVLEATRMYQPVKGTDKTSRYYVIALHPDLTVACRVTGSFNVSLRIESHNPKVITQITKANPTLTLSKSGHASMHLDCGTELMANRVIGGFITSLGLDFDTPIPFSKEIRNG